MAIIINDPRQDFWNQLAYYLGNFGATYYMNKDALNKIENHIVDPQVYNQVKQELGDGVADMIFTPTESGKYKLNVDSLNDLLRNSEEYASNPIMEYLANLGTAQQEFSDKNIFAKLKAIQNPTVVSSLAITGSGIKKTKKKAEQQEILKEAIPEILGLPEEYSPIYDIIMKDLNMSPLIYLYLMKGE